MARGPASGYEKPGPGVFPYMSLSNVAFIRSTAILLLVGLAVLLGIVALTFWLSVRTAELSEDITAQRRLRSATVEMRSILADAETGQRGFLLTREDDYLKPYRDALQRLPSGLALLKERAAAGTEADEVARLEELTTEKMAELKQTLDLEAAGQHDEAVAIVRSDRGRAVMDEARAIIGGMIERVDGRLIANMDSQTSAITNLQRAVIAGTLFIIIVVGASAVIALRYTRELVHARAELATLNLDLENRVADRTADLARANAEIQRFAYIVGHDLRAPLVNIMGFTTELLEQKNEFLDSIVKLRLKANIPAAPEEKKIEEDFDESVSFIRASTAKMDSLINAILRISRDGRRALTPERLDMTALITAAAANIQHRIDEKRGEIRLEGPFPGIVSDRLSLDQVFGNLFDNASKYGHAARPPEIVARGRIEGDQAFYEIEDNGRGVAPNEHERIFELFRRAGQQDQQGEGIGLAAVRANVRRLGGDITLVSEPGKGSTFTVRLPRVLTLEPAS